MDIQYLGTAAAEGIPALFCNCPICRYAREHGGHSVRSRCQTLIDDRLLIDFPADSYLHSVQHGIDLSSVRNLLVTHSHDDHFYPMDLLMRLEDYGIGWGTQKLHIYGNTAVCDLLTEMAQRFSVPRIWTSLEIHEIKPLESFDIEDYHITALPANHMKTEEALVYLIEKNGTTYLHGNDTGLPPDGFYQGLLGKHLNALCMDCTMGMEKSNYWGHMGYADVADVKKELDKNGITDSHTQWILTHFSHNGTWKDVCIENDMMRTGMTVAYDGMKVTI